jgi:spore germination protein YaaH
MTTEYSAVLKALVTEKTITQAQSDKVLVVVTANMQGGRAGGGKKNQLAQDLLMNKNQMTQHKQINQNLKMIG